VILFLYHRTNDCLPDTQENGYIIPVSGASALPTAQAPGDPRAFDDQTVAFNCKRL
jgi:hypothetical protein